MKNHKVFMTRQYFKMKSKHRKILALCIPINIVVLNQFNKNQLGYYFYKPDVDHLVKFIVNEKFPRH